ncbi:MAG: DUF2589 domain-containing protein [Bacteroidota bacterium]
MISLESFTESLQKAILGAHKALSKSQLSYLDEYFEEVPEPPPSSPPTGGGDFTGSMRSEEDFDQAAQAIDRFFGKSTDAQYNNFTSLFQDLNTLRQGFVERSVNDRLLAEVLLQLNELPTQQSEDPTRPKSGLSDLTSGTTFEEQNVMDLSMALSALSQTNAGTISPQNTSSSSSGGSRLRPKTVTLQYPHQTSEGLKLVDVRVPLITLVSLSPTQIEEVKLRIGLELMLDENARNEEDKLLVKFLPPPSTPTGSPPDPPTSPPPKETHQSFIELKFGPSDTPEGIRKLVEGYEKILRAQIPH